MKSYLKWSIYFVKLTKVISFDNYLLYSERYFLYIFHTMTDPEGTACGILTAGQVHGCCYRNKILGDRETERTTLIETSHKYRSK